MKKTDATPLWVFLAFSSIESRRGALILVWISLIFSLYCVPWFNYFNFDDRVAKLFLVNDWVWFAVMLATTVWYWLSLRWIDKNGGW
ncbi:MAG: hypothetical protein ABFD75_00545 [Smithella sp.]